MSIDYMLKSSCKRQFQRSCDDIELPSRIACFCVFALCFCFLFLVLHFPVPVPANLNTFCFCFYFSVIKTQMTLHSEFLKMSGSNAFGVWIILKINYHVLFYLTKKLALNLGFGLPTLNPNIFQSVPGGPLTL